MKFLDLPQLSPLQHALNHDLGESILVSRIEAYSCKRAGSDKKLARSLESDAFRALATSPFGPMTESASRKTLLYLVSTLNAAYVDYDFTNTSPEQFRKEHTTQIAINSIDSTLSGVLGPSYAALRERIWATIELEMQLPKCTVYSYLPEIDDPFTEDGTLWSFNFFFYNKTLKRLLYFSCRAISKTSAQANDPRMFDPSDERVAEDSSDEESWGAYDQDVANNMEW
eukprot:TRINITY_DN3161_c0_g1_i5.p1 TRINITY_DN3161_c0_g1~~TRINITY_DN3161_c0_g1_i5.p1  ORF type:complete len:227 (-),score=60.00 TRINITY_DN3161_c0_g1_i5:72-752(-)